VQEARKIAVATGRSESIGVTQVEQGYNSQFSFFSSPSVEPAILKCRLKGYWVWNSASNPGMHLTQVAGVTVIGSAASSPASSMKSSAKAAASPKEPVDFVNVDQMHHPEK
jgi:hypothetical protein